MAERFRIEAHDQGLDQELQTFFAQDEGGNASMQLQLDHSPNVWESLSANGRKNTILVVKDTYKDQIASTMICSHKTCHFHGEIRKIVYVSGLKVGLEYRRGIVIKLIFLAFKEYCERSGIRIWLFSVFENNKIALHFFTKKGDFLPLFRETGESVTYVFKRRFLDTQVDSECCVETAIPEDLPQINDFIQSQGYIRANLPDYEMEELQNGSGILNGFRLEDLVVARKKGKIVGMMGLWDQSRYKRWKVVRYSGLVRRLRSIINLVARISHYPELPQEQSNISYKLLSLILIKNDDLKLAKRLFNALMSKIGGDETCSVTLSADSPLNTLFKGRSISFRNVLFQAAYPQHVQYMDSINLNNYYIESGSL